MSCSQAELRRAQQLAVELRKEVQLKKQLAERKTKYVCLPFLCPVSASQCRITGSFSSFSIQGAIFHSSRFSGLTLLSILLSSLWWLPVA